MKYWSLTALFLLAVAAVAAPPAYKVTGKIKIGGVGRWDYVYVDSANHRLYVSHATQTEVIDTDTDKIVGTIPDTGGVHGIAVAAGGKFQHGAVHVQWFDRPGVHLS